jgi:acyl-coenzyme A synthetase/AMP-(fatty) acid ligase
VPSAFGPPGARLYRTGDLARWTGEGVIEFLGRVDHQVKLRGMRIELGEVEALLRGLPGIRDAVVVVHGTAPEDRQLVAYLTAAPGIAGDTAQVRSAVARQLPAAMVPTTMVWLDSLPLTHNGKVDRALLPPPRVRRQNA